VTIPAWLGDDQRTRYVHRRPEQPGRHADFPEWVSDDVREAIGHAGVTRLWQHQALAADAAYHGQHVCLSTGTASGKTLAYLLPVLAASVDGRVGSATTDGHETDRHETDGRESAPSRRNLPGALGIAGQGYSALYLAPTKALAHDQLRVCQTLGLPGWRVTTLDGDSPDAERRFARDFGQYVLTNPDMLHRAVLPNHRHWTRLLSTLRYVVIDEAHRYRGVFGAHVSGVLRRLRRLAVWYGADPVFVAASATVADGAGLLARLAGVDDVLEVATDTSAHPALDFAVWQPDDDPHHDAAAMLARLVAEGRQTLCFTTSRVQAELVAVRAGRALGDADAIASYRSGYLAWDRRDVERRLQDGTLRGVASTNALELGVDISGVDAVITCGFPGTRAALWQQAGRAGRSGRDALAVLVAKNDPLDAYLCDHPDTLVGEPVEQTVLHPDNPRVLGPHLAAAAQESPLTASDDRFFGPTTAALADRLAAEGLLRRRANSWYWTRPDRAADAIDLRTSAGGVVDIVDAATGRVIGVADPSTADRVLHQGAVYLHQGVSWHVESYVPDAHTATVVPDDGTYTTQALADAAIAIESVARSRACGHADISFGDVALTSQVIGYLRRDRVTGQVWDSTELSLPVRTLHTQAVWWTVDDDALDAAHLAPRTRAGAAHAAEHTAIGLLPAFAPCDRWDIGGLSTLNHPDTGRLTVFVHDGHPGGAGFAERGYQVFDAWMRATAERLRTCACADGCPRCVVSPKCGNGNHPLDKQAAARLLALLVS